MPADRPSALVIGASPVMLFEALLLARRGVKVTVCEAQPSIGGSWSTATHFGIEMDAGVHFFYFAPGIADRGYRWIGGLSGTPFVPMRPQPTGDARLGLMSVPEASFGRRPPGWRSGARQIVYSMRRHARALLGARYRYPRGGCGGWLADLRRALQAQGAEIRLNNRITSLSAEDGRISCIDEANEVLRADRALVSSRARIGQMRAGPETIRIAHDPLSLTHAFLRLRAPGPRRFSVHKFLDDAHMFIASDMRHAFAPGSEALPADEAIVACALNKGVEEADVTAEGLTEKLRERGLIAPEAALLASEFAVNRSINANRDDIAGAQTAFGDSVRFIAYDNIAKGFADCLARQRRPTRPGGA